MADAASDALAITRQPKVKGFDPEPTEGVKAELRDETGARFIWLERSFLHFKWIGDEITTVLATEFTLNMRAKTSAAPAAPTSGG